MTSLAIAFARKVHTVCTHAFARPHAASDAVGTSRKFRGSAARVTVTSRLQLGAPPMGAVRSVGREPPAPAVVRSDEVVAVVERGVGVVVGA